MDTDGPPRAFRHRCPWPSRTPARRTIFWAFASATTVAGLYEYGNRPSGRCVLALLALGYVLRWELDRRADRIAERRAEFWRERDAR